MNTWLIVGQDPWTIISTHPVNNFNENSQYISFTLTFQLTRNDIIDSVVNTMDIFLIPSIVVDSVDTWLIVDRFLMKLPVLSANQLLCMAQ